MLKDFAEQSTVYVVTGYSDLRKGIDGLAAIVQGVLKQDPFSKSLFLFCGRRRDRIKVSVKEMQELITVKNIS